MNRLVDLSREVTSSSRQFDSDQGNDRETPHLRRVAYVGNLDYGLWALCKDSVITNIAVDILGPYIRFRDFIINFKWTGGGAIV